MIVDNEKLLKTLFQERASIYLPRIELFDSGLAEMTEKFEDWLQIENNVHALFTLRGEKTFGIHWDPDPCFIFQLEGKKQWDIFEHILQFPVGVGERAGYSHSFGTETARKIDSFVLNEGDILYMPGGLPHNVKTFPEYDSLHILFVLRPTPWISITSFLQEEIAKHCKTDIDFRKPAWNFSNRNDHSAEKLHFKKLIGRIVKQLNSADLEEVFDSFLLANQNITPTQAKYSWQTLQRQQPITKKTKFKRTRMKIGLKEYPEYIRVQLSKSLLMIDPKALAVLRFINKNQEFSFTDLPGPAAKKQNEEILNILVNYGALLTVQ